MQLKIKAKRTINELNNKRNDNLDTWVNNKESKRNYGKSFHRDTGNRKLVPWQNFTIRQNTNLDILDLDRSQVEKLIGRISHQNHKNQINMIKLYPILKSWRINIRNLLRESQNTFLKSKRRQKKDKRRWENYKIRSEN